MIKGYVQGQTLKLAQTRVVADTIDYLIAKFTFQGEDWRGLDKWMHLQKGEEVYAVRLTDDRTKKEDHLNLGAGEWSVWLHGNEQADGQVTLRVTTNICTFTVEASGAMSGDALPELPVGVGEELTARVAALEQAQKEPKRELPSVTTQDEGRVLTVVGGAWAAAEAPNGGSDIVVDAALSETSENPVQNKAVAKVVREANAAMTQLGGAVEALGQRVTPEVTAEDNGRVLTVVDGAWAAAEAPSGGSDIVVDAALSETSENPVQNKAVAKVVREANAAMTQLGGAVEALGQRVTPEVTAEDNGRVLTVVGGAWAAAEAPSGGSDIVVDAALSETSENPVQNKVITQEFAALYQGVGASMEELSRRVTPEVTAGDNGKVLTVVDGEWKAAEASSGGGSSGGSADLSELLETVTEPQELLPRTAFTNDYFADLGAFGQFLDIDEATYNAWSANTEPVIVRYDGVEYVLEPQSIDPYGSGQPGIGVGNLAAFGGVGNGESFALVAMFDVNSDGGMIYGFLCGSMVDTTPTQHTLAMYLQGEAVKLKAAYLPGAVIRAYVEEYIDEALGGDY